jgi:hypothetical protein
MATELAVSVAATVVLVALILVLVVLATQRAGRGTAGGAN